jgi:Family of unknown function (DUF6399)
MTPSQPTDPPGPRQEPFRWPRSQATALLQQAQGHADSPSLRAFAAEHDMPPSTLHYWRRRRQRLDAPQPLRDFFESAPGLALLGRIVLAAHLVFQQTGACGVRPLLAFFEHAGLAPFLACSFGSHQQLACLLQGLLARYGQEQRQALAAGMPARKITLCEDETFHQGRPCLVAIEPVSNFLVVECYQPRRDAATWGRVVGQAPEGLPVEVVQVTSDLAKGILAHAKDGLGAQHSPDLMHLQQDLHRATSLPLQAQVEQARQAATQAEYQAFLAAFAQVEWASGGPRPGRPPDFAARLEPRKEQLRQAERELARCQQSQQQVREAIRGLGDDYHPFDAAAAAPVQPEALRQRLQGRLAVVEAAAEQAGVSEACEKKIRKVRRLLPQLVAALAWFWLQVREAAAQAGWSEGERELFEKKVLAWAYWEQASRRGRDAAHRQQLRGLARACQEAVEADACWQGFSEQRRQQMRRLGQQCAGRWVRSSSCVEGRNGVLRLRHHGRAGLSERALGALTVLHNYWIRRADGTTAAGRFFGQEPEDLFDWLLQRFPELPRPARSRKQAA